MNDFQEYEQLKRVEQKIEKKIESVMNLVELHKIYYELHMISKRRTMILNNLNFFD